VFWRKSNGIKVYLLVYVDDFLLITSTSLEHEIESIKQEIAKLYTIKDLGKAEYFLGIHFQYSPGSIKLSQTAYIQKLLDRFNMTNCKSILSPMPFKANYSEKRLATAAETLAMINVPCREAIGALMFLSVRTRPEIAVAVGSLATHVQQSLPLHWSGVKRILRYLHGTANDGLVFNKVPDHEFTLAIYADSDWATNPEDRRSRSGSVCQLGDNTVWWKSRKQNSVAVSRCESEYMALLESAKDALWLRNLLLRIRLLPWIHSDHDLSRQPGLNFVGTG
jgi:Reverse transcriptase (RNA-dependent DNA polymerase)